MAEARRALVTGVTGFIGGELARGLLERGWTVSGLARGESRAKVPAGVAPVIGDLGDAASLARAVQGHDVVFHSAALLSEPARKSDEVLWQTANVTGTVALARAALAAGVARFVQVSTIGVYGNESRTLTEETPGLPDSVYHRTKLEADDALLALHRTEKLPVVILRPPITVGPGNLKTHLLKMAKLAAKDRFPTFGSDMKQRLPLVEIEDLVDALLLAADTSALGEMFLISSGAPYSFGEILAAMARFSGASRGTLAVPGWIGTLGATVCERIAEATGWAPPLTHHKLAAFRQDRAMDITKARTKLGFAPRHVDLDDLLRRALEDYRARGLLPTR